MPGFETGLRHVCFSGAPRYLAMYDMKSPAVLDSPEYLRVSFGNASPGPSASPAGFASIARLGARSIRAMR